MTKKWITLTPTWRWLGSMYIWANINTPCTSYLLTLYFRDLYHYTWSCVRKVIYEPILASNSWNIYLHKLQHTLPSIIWCLITLEHICRLDWNILQWVWCFSDIEATSCQLTQRIWVPHMKFRYFQIGLSMGNIRSWCFYGGWSY